MVALSSPCWESTRESRDGLEGPWAVLWPQFCLEELCFLRVPLSCLKRMGSIRSLELRSWAWSRMTAQLGFITMHVE